MASPAYIILVEPIPAEDGGGFFATVPDLPDCVSDGETKAEALSNAHAAIADWMAHARETGRPIPPPRQGLAQLLDRMTPETFPDVIDLGDPIGKEAW